MTKKKHDISDYITAHVAAQLLTIKHGRVIKPKYICRIRSLSRIKLADNLALYLKSDVEAVQLRAENRKKMEPRANEKR